MALSGLGSGHGSHDASANGVPGTRCWPASQPRTVHGTQAAPAVEKFPLPHWAHAPPAVMENPASQAHAGLPPTTQAPPL